VANSERTFPEEWIAPSRTDVTDEFVDYAQPLIGMDWPSIPLIDGLQRYTKFAQIYAEQKLDDYVPQAYQE
jgi:6-phosphofructokinase 1